MSIGDLIFWYAVIFCVLLVPFIWLLLKRRADKTRTNGVPSRQRIDWKSLLAFRPQQVLTGEIWLKSSIAAFVALCAGVIIVVFIFPLGAAWAAVAAFVAVLIIVGLLFTLMD
jgi:VIT1/CCC1 family predicted Fe2+/Mn2+ transporter